MNRFPLLFIAFLTFNFSYAQAQDNLTAREVLDKASETADSIWSLQVTCNVVSDIGAFDERVESVQSVYIDSNNYKISMYAEGDLKLEQARFEEMLYTHRVDDQEIVVIKDTTQLTISRFLEMKGYDDTSFTIERSKDDRVNGEDCFVIKLIYKDNDDTDKKTLYISMEDFLIRKVIIKFKRYDWILTSEYNEFIINEHIPESTFIFNQETHPDCYFEEY